MSFADPLSVSASTRGGHPALLYAGDVITYERLDTEVSALAASLSDLGVERGDRVAIWLPNHPAFVTSLYAAWRAGAVVVPVNPVLTWHEARYILSDSGSRVLVCAEPQYAQAGEGLGGLEDLEHVAVVGAEPAQPHVAFETLVAGGIGAASGVELSADALAMLGYTSGTTGLPKGAMLTHGNLHANIEQMLTMPVAPGPDDVALGILPLSHIYGLNVLLNLAIGVGATLILQDRFDPVESLRTIREHRVTRLASAPPAYVAWLRTTQASASDFRTVTVASSGAAPLGADVHRAFTERFGVTIWEGYGLTETSPVVSSTAVGGVAKPGSVGRPLPGVDVRLLDLEGEDVEQGDPGEVVVRGPNVFRGYWGDPDETAQALHDGWFRTGDIAIADEDGDLFLVDRTRDLILVSGFNVYPKEIEDVLLAHPKVRDGAAVGAPDELHGEHVRALVVAEPGTGLTDDELLSWCRTRLAPFKVPSVVELVEAIPRNAAGKMLRRELR